MSIPDEGIALKVAETEGITRRKYPLTRGVPLPQGIVAGVENLSLQDAQGRDVPAQLRVLGRWPDGSAKWVLVDFQADVEAGQEAVYTLQYTDQKAAANVQGVEITDREDRFEVCTGPLRFGIGKKAFALFDGVELGERAEGSFVSEVEVAPRGGGDAWAKISESEFVGGTQRRIYGMGGTCLASEGRGGIRRRDRRGRPLAGGDLLPRGLRINRAHAPLRRLSPAALCDADLRILR